MEKLNRKKYILPAVLVLVVVLLVALPFIIDSSRKKFETEASIISGVVEKTDITSTISGTGTLTDGESVEIQLPDGVRLKSYIVNNGDVVKKGDALAMVDRVSVMEAISSVQETLTYLEEEMNAASGQYAESYITASVSGTVKKVYAQAGDSVRDVMLSHGALALVSLDGLMAVDISTDEVLTVGESVAVIFSDGTEKSGTVKAALDGKLSITLADEDYELGESVVVKTLSGRELGSGELYLNRAWSATAFTGTVSNCYTAEGSDIYSGSTLFYISDTAYTGQYELLAQQHREYEELMAQLVVMYQEECISAPADGMVWGISEDTVELLASKSNQGFFVTLLSNVTKKEPEYQLMLLSDTEPEPTPEATETPEPVPTSEPVATPAPGDEPEPEPSTEPVPEPSQSPDVILPQYSYYVGVVTGSGTANINPEPVEDVSDEASYTTSLGTDSMTSPISFGGVPVFSGGAAYTPAVWDILLFVYEDGSLVRAVKISQSGGIPGGSGAMGGMSGMGGFSGGSMGGTVTEEEYELFPLEGTTIMTVTPMDKVSVSFSVDELDILSISKGQPAMITIDAMPGQSFDGVVTDIDINGESRKFTVKVSFDRTEKMLAGYNCSITITTGTKQAVASVPVEAQVELGGHTYLYTGYDKKTDELTDPVEIETGVSDGLMVEVNLPEGSEYWYEYYDEAPIVFPF